MSGNACRDQNCAQNDSLSSLARTTRPHDLFHIPYSDFGVGDPVEALPFPLGIGFPAFEKVYHQIGV